MYSFLSLVSFHLVGKLEILIHGGEIQNYQTHLKLKTSSERGNDMVFSLVNIPQHMLNIPRHKLHIHQQMLHILEYYVNGILGFIRILQKPNHPT